MPQPSARSRSGATQRASLLPFVVLAVVAVVVLTAGWLWFAFAFFEEWSEQCKATAAGTTMAGTGAALGLAPLIALHVVMLLVLIGTARRGQAAPNIGLGLGATAVASASALLVAQLLSNGTVFAYSAQTALC